MRTLIRNIGLLAGISTAARKEGAAMDEVACLEDAWLLIEDGMIRDFGGVGFRENVPETVSLQLDPTLKDIPPEAERVIDADGAMISSLCKMLLMVGNEPMQQGVIHLHAPLQLRSATALPEDSLFSCRGRSRPR